MRSSLRALALVLTVATTAPLVTTSQVAHAADDKAKARATFNEGVQLEAAGNYADALRKFQEVAQVAATPTVRFHIAFCQEKLGRLVEALGGYRMAAHEAEADGKSAKVAETANEALAALEKRIPKLTIKRGRGAEMAKISVDGSELGASAADKPQHLDPGSHEVTATATGKEPFSQIVKLGEGDSKTVEVALKSKAAAAVEDEPKKDDKPDEAKKGEVKIDQESSALPYIALGGGGAMLLASGYFYTRRNAARDELADQCINNVCPESAKGTQDRGKSAATMSTITLGLGVVGVGVGAYLLLSGKPEDAKKEARRRWVDVGVGPTKGGLAAAVSGRFLEMNTGSRALSLLLPLSLLWAACSFPENEFDDAKYERLKRGNSAAGSSAAGSAQAGGAGTAGTGTAGTGTAGDAGSGGGDAGSGGGDAGTGGTGTAGTGGTTTAGAGGTTTAGTGGTGTAGAGGTAAGAGGAGTGGTGAGGTGTMNGPCTGNNQCTGGQICSNIDLLGEKITCQTPNASGKEIGEACGKNADCKSKFCDLAGAGTCLAGCNATSDCTGGSVCVQYLTSTPFMLCMKPCTKNEVCPANGGGTKTCMLHEDTLNDDFALTCDYLGATPQTNPKVKTFGQTMGAMEGCDTNVNLSVTKDSVTTTYCSKTCEGPSDCGGALPNCQPINATRPSGSGTTAFKACTP